MVRVEEGKTGVFSTVSAVDLHFKIRIPSDIRRGPAIGRPDFSAATGDADGTFALHGWPPTARASTVQQLVYALQNDVSDDTVLGYKQATTWLGWSNPAPINCPA